ncbi:unnamed protein product [Clonostachys byssicola]|uniref:2-dehydropantoate 2-reductase n=1 Tax=Clonostachys byssicola TaxID=160290 RepID=A0A9N9Y063_9HYPO|nr:unnamed protein product [Clonostachys byssicola]
MSRSVLIYGGGCIGAVVSFMISATIPARDLAIICRSNHEEVTRKGLTLHSTIWGKDLQISPMCFKTVEEAVERHRPEYDYVFITTKGQSKLDTNTEVVAPAISAQTAIVLMQNGIAIEAPWRERFPCNPIISAVLYLPVSQVEPSVFTHALHTEIQIGIYPSQCPEDDSRAEAACDELCAMLKRGGAAVTVEDDVQVARWKKILVNGSENPVCALTQLPDATFLQSSPLAIQRTRELMEEIAAIARAVGYPQIDQEVVEAQLSFITARPLPGVVPSMMADVKAKRPMEIEPLLGNLLMLAKESSTPSPRLQLVYALLKGLNLSYNS